MATLAFDTHKAVKALREAGFDDSQAEAVTERISAAIGENLVTKDDLDNAVEKLELRITTRTYAAIVVGVGSIEGLDFLLGRPSPSSRRRPPDPRGRRRWPVRRQPPRKARRTSGSAASADAAPSRRFRPSTRT